MTNVHRVGRSPLSRIVLIAVCAFAVVPFMSSRCDADNVPPKVRAAINRGVSYIRETLKSRGNIGATGPSAIGAYAMIKGKAPLTDPVIVAVVEGVRKKVDANGVYKGSGIYIAGVDMMLLEAASKKTAKYNRELQAIVDYIVKNQNSEGYWNYLGGDKHGDTSVTQYGALALWAASRAGLKVPAETWDRMAGWLLRTQSNGGWRYRPGTTEQPFESQSMSVAGASSLFVAAMHLYPDKLEEVMNKENAAKKKKKRKERRLQDVNLEYSEKEKKGGKVPIEYKPKNSFERIYGSAKRGLGWVSNAARSGIVIGEWFMYTAYGIERMAALANVKTLGGRDWYAVGSARLLQIQKKDGSWRGKATQIPSTAFGILFLSKSTAITLGRADEFGAGLLRGNSGLPDNLDELELDANGQVKKAEQFNGDAGSLLKMFDDLGKLKPKDAPKADQFVKAFQNLKKEDREKFLDKKHRKTVLKLIEHPSPIPRSIGIWVLGRTGDVEHVKLLIKALESDPDLDVAIEARNALCWISRKPRGFGLSANPKLSIPLNVSKKQRLKALAQWREQAVMHWKKWYFTVRPYDERDDLSETPDTVKN